MPATLRVPADLSNLSVIRGFIQDTAAALGFKPGLIMDMIQAVDEAVTNIVVHGYRGRPGDIEIEMSREQASLVVRLRDRAVPFDPTQAPPPDLTLPLESAPFGRAGDLPDAPVHGCLALSSDRNWEQ